MCFDHVCSCLFMTMMMDASTDNVVEHAPKNSSPIGLVVLAVMRKINKFELYTLINR